MKKNLCIVTLLSAVLVFSFGFNNKISAGVPYSCTDIQVNLKQGSKGTYVVILQNFLIHSGYLYANADGSFGLKTKNALMAYQRANNIIPASGLFGPISREKVKSESCGYTNIPTMSTGNNTVYFSNTFFGFEYVYGTSWSRGNDQQLTITNGSNSDVNIQISVENQPNWLRVSPSDGVLTITPGQPLSMSVSVDPTKISGDSDQAYIKVTGNFAGSPKLIPVTFKMNKTGVDTVQFNSQAYKSVTNDFNRIVFNNIPTDWSVLANDYSGTLLSTDISNSRSASLIFLPISILKNEYTNKFTNIKEALSTVSPNVSLDDIQKNMLVKVSQSTTTKDWTVIEKLADGYIGNKPALVSTISSTNVTSGQKNTFKQVIFLNNNVIYMILFASTDSDYNSYLPVFDNIKNSVTFY